VAKMGVQKVRKKVQKIVQKIVQKKVQKIIIKNFKLLEGREGGELSFQCLRPSAGKNKTKTRQTECCSMAVYMYTVHVAHAWVELQSKCPKAGKYFKKTLDFLDFYFGFFFWGGGNLELFEYVRIF
jgi:hypothetical protein